MGSIWELACEDIYMSRPGIRVMGGVDVGRREAQLLLAICAAGG
jgi:hypothetical protein